MKVTMPVELTVNVPLPATVKLESGVGVLGSRSTLPGTIVLPGLAMSLASASRVTGVLNDVVVLSSIAAGTTTVTFRLAGLLVCPRLSLMVYGMLEMPTKFSTGVKVTTPVLGLRLNVPSSGLVNVVCCPGVLGSRSMLVGSRVVPVPGVSLLTGFRLTGLFGVVVALSSVAIGAGVPATVIDKFAGLEVDPKLSLIVYGVVDVSTKPFTGVKVTTPLEFTLYVPSFGLVKVVCCPGVLGSRSMLLELRVAPVLAVSLLGAFRLTGVLNGVMVLFDVATGAAGGATVTVKLAWLLGVL
jgi:hypothetical protein